MSKRRKTRKIKVGSLFIGGQSPVSVQTMTNARTGDVAATVRQIKEVEKAGADLVRVAVPDLVSARAIGAIKKKIKIPLIADIHFDYRLALESVRQGIDKLRINPGNIGSTDRVKAVVEAAKKKKIPIRIGVNMGSLEPAILKRYGRNAVGMVQSALGHIRLLEKHGFNDIIVAMKASDVERTVAAYQLLAQKIDYPFHLGVTEAGTTFSGTIKSSIGLGSLLLKGIGDTLRVSLTGPLSEEIAVGQEILQALGLRQFRVTIASCPTCARTTIAVEKLAKQLEKKLAEVKKPLHLAVMGCVVNGPGEAAEADLGITGVKGKAVLFKKGKVYKTVPVSRAIPILLAEIKKLR